jgi:LuxR family maltose regulon positive regulatory protein
VLVVLVGVRIGVPEAPPQQVTRQRLLSRLDLETPGAVALVEAPAGWGKTTLLTMWAHSPPFAGRVVWLTVDEQNPPSARSWVLDALAGEASRRPLAVIVDDVHHLRDEAALAGLDDAIQRTRTGVRFVLAGRHQPASLHRWRINGVSTEFNRTDLGLNVMETRALLATYQVELTDAAVLHLHALTEGWPVGLRLAAMSLRDDPTVDAIADDGGYLSRYVDAEVLAPLPAEARRLLAEGAVVEQLNADLYEALTGRDDGASVLAALEWDTGFVTRVPGGWYRYHPLFGSILYAQLAAADADRVLELHRAASRWHAMFGLPTEALRHALMAGDRQQVELVFEQHSPELLAGPRRHSLRPASASPAAQADTAGLAMAYAAERLDAGDPEGAYAQLVAAASAPDPVVGSTEPEQAQVVTAIALGAARLQSGHPAEAERELQDAYQRAHRIGLTQAQLTAASLLAAASACRGQLRATVRAARDAQATADRYGMAFAGELAWARLALAETYYQWDRLTEAWRLVEEAMDEAYLEPAALAVATLVRARVCAASGDRSGGGFLSAGARQEVLDPALPTAIRRALVLTEAELRLGLGDPAIARRLVSDWHEERSFPAWAAVIEGGVLLAEGRAPAAATAVEPYLAADGPSLTSTVHAGLVTALAGRAIGDRRLILRGLESALAIAEEQGHRRAFMAGGHPVRDLIERFGPGMPVYRPVVRELTSVELPVGEAVRGRPANGEVPPLIEPLTARELIVLRHLQGTMSNVEIAAILYLSVNTVKTHAKNIYRKLQASRRREAVQRARQLRLL